MTDISVTISVRQQTLIMGVKMSLETLVIFNQWSRLIAREYFINLAAVKASDLATELNL
jgi:hypothetical protein